MKEYTCTLILDGDPHPYDLDYPLVAIEREPGGVVDYYEASVRPKPKGRYYVSFYGPDGFKCWANWVTQGEPFVARQTKKYRFTVGGSRKPAQQIRLYKADRSNRRITRRNGSSMF